MHALSFAFSAALVATLAAGAAVVRQDDCYGPGERNQGAEGYPSVDYKPCCDGQASVSKDGDWGMFCPGGGGGGGDCYGPGERNQGAEGYPGVDYKPCCDGQASVSKDGDWGMFCPGGSGGGGGGDDVPYNPLKCAGVYQCGCNAGYPQCSQCPDDGGSSHQYDDVCWCSDLPWGATPTGNECNPDKNYGPYMTDKLEYVPITCDSANDCGCKWNNGDAKCSWCPNDYGSPTQYQNVCWCTNFWWNNSEVECNSLGDNGPTRVENNGGGNNNGGGDNTVPYNPIECYTDKQCGCAEWGANAQCSWCPDDEGSPYKEKNVCWCDDAFGNNSGARECNPNKPKGPFKIDIDDDGYTYDPIVCDPNGSQCRCEFGTASCGVCPFDNGSQWQGYNVCWCNYEGYTKEGFYPHANNPSGECNPQKYLGPSFNWN